MTDAVRRLDCDLAIAGGGLVGASLALALAPVGLRIVVVEAVVPAGDGGHPSYDERTTALANGTVRTFQGLGVWRHMQREATPIRRIHVSEQGRFGVARIDAAEQGLESLGCVLPNRVIGAALWEGLRAAAGVEIVAPASVVSTALEDGIRVLRAERDGQPLEIRARLVVAADGARSAVREQAGIASEHLGYGQTAIVTTMTAQRFHDHVAYERFTPDGPIAVLPLADGRCGVVWTRRPEEAARLLALPDEEFLAGFQAAFGFRLGRFIKVGSGTRMSFRFPAPSATSARGSRSWARPRRACTRSPARDSTSGCAMQPVSRRSSPTPAPPVAWTRVRRRCSTPTPRGARKTAGASLRSPTGWCASSVRHSAWCADCAASGCSPSTPSRRPRRRCRG